MFKFSLSRPLTRMLALLLLAFGFTSASAQASSDAGQIWGEDYFTNVSLITHEGKTIRFFDDLIKDKVVMVNFIFTSCPDVCPLETARLREVQKLLGDRVGKDVFMYSITIDPKVDTPAVLKAYREKFQVEPGWTFLTGKPDDIIMLRKKLGMYGKEDEAGILSTHNLSLILGNQKSGKWMKSSPFENPYILATQVGSWLHNWKLPPKPIQEYQDAPQVRAVSKGEALFRTRCAACHTIGAGNILASAKQPIGPDLLGVTKNRERAWLIRWLAEPDKMLAEKDPLAVSLLAAYNNVPMPNLRLNQLEIEALLEFLQEESARVEHLRSPGHKH